MACGVPLTQNYSNLVIWAQLKITFRKTKELPKIQILFPYCWLQEQDTVKPEVTSVPNLHREALTHSDIQTIAICMSILSIANAEQSRKTHILKRGRHLPPGPYLWPQKDGRFPILPISPYYSECSKTRVCIRSAKQNTLVTSWEIRTFLCPLKSQQTLMQGKACHKSSVSRTNLNLIETNCTVLLWHQKFPLSKPQTHEVSDTDDSISTIYTQP